MKFTEAIDKDLQIFMNLDEFAETHEINGVEVTCVISTMTHERSGNQSQKFDGLHGDFQTIYIKSDAIERIPAEGESIRVDNRRFTVESTINQQGITRIELASYRGRGL